MAVISRGRINCATWESLLCLPLSSDVHWNTLSDPFTVQLTDFRENWQNSFRRGDHTAIKVQMLTVTPIRLRSFKPQSCNHFILQLIDSL